MTGFYYVLHAETEAALEAAVAAFPIEPQTIGAEIYDDKPGLTAAGFSAAAPLPGFFLLAGVDQALTDDELLAVLAVGVTLSAHAKAPALQGFATRITETPEAPPEPEADEGDDEPEGGAE